MLLNPNHLNNVFTDFVDSTIAPKANGLQKLGAYSLVFILNAKMNEILEQYTPTMKMIGVMNEEGMIDLDYTYNMLSSATSKAGKVGVLGYNMDSSDIETMYSIAKRYVG